MSRPFDWQPLAVLGAVVVLDQLSKLWVVATFSLYESRSVIAELFSLTYLLNTGAAFGLLAGDKQLWRQLFFVGVGSAALGAMFFAWRHYRDKLRLFPYALALIAGGAIGNLIDRIRQGAVIDFLDFYIGAYHWPAFNVADSAICVGVGLFLLAGWLDERRNAAKKG